MASPCETPAFGLQRGVKLENAPTTKKPSASLGAKYGYAAMPGAQSSVPVVPYLGGFPVLTLVTWR